MRVTRRSARTAAVATGAVVALVFVMMAVRVVLHRVSPMVR